MDNGAANPAYDERLPSARIYVYSTLGLPVEIKIVPKREFAEWSRRAILATVGANLPGLRNYDCAG